MHGQRGPFGHDPTDLPRFSDGASGIAAVRVLLSVMVAIATAPTDAEDPVLTALFLAIAVITVRLRGAPLVLPLPTSSPPLLCFVKLPPT